MRRSVRRLIFLVFLVLFGSSSVVLGEYRIPLGVKQLYNSDNWRFTAHNNDNTLPDTVVYVRGLTTTTPPDIKWINIGALVNPDSLNYPTGNETFLTREMHRLSGIGANTLYMTVANPLEHLKYLDSGDLNTKIMFSSYQDQWETDPENAYGDGMHTRISQLFSRHCRYNFATQDSLFEQLRDLLNNVSYQKGFDGYWIMVECWARSGMTNPPDVDRCVTLLNAIADTIRQRDQTNHIMHQHCFMNGWETGQNVNDRHRDAKRIFRPHLFSEGEGARGWSLFINYDHQFKVHAYNAEWYYKHNWFELHRGHRLISLEMEHYKSVASNWQPGPEPEWWHCLSSERSWYADNGVWKFGRRRPTRYEHRMEAYSALACGAKGITLWPYASADARRLTPATTVFTGAEYIEPMELENSSSNELDENIPTIPVQDGASMGLISPEGRNAYELFINDQTDQDDLDRVAANIGKFRLPLSASEDNADDNYFDTNERYNSGNNDYYIYDDIAKLYTALGTLVPTLRNLRWWWASTTGITDTSLCYHYSYYSDIYDDTSLYPHQGFYSLEDELNAIYDAEGNQLDRFGVSSLADRFSLREVNECHCDSFSNIIVGYFGNPTEGDIGDLPVDPLGRIRFLHGPEYYLVVNQRCNRESNDIIYDANPHQIVMVFDNITGKTLTVAWNDPESGSQIDSCHSDTCWITLDPGDALLLRYARNTAIIGNTTYSTTQTIDGPRTYIGDVTVSSGADLTLDGNFTFQEDLIVTGSGTKLILEEGSCLHFRKDKHLIIQDNATFEALGTISSPICFTHEDLYAAQDSLWGGILFDAPSSANISVKNLDIQYANTGIRLLNYGGMITFDSLHIANCDTGFYSQDSYVTQIDHSTIEYCNHGVSGNQTSGNKYFKFRGSTVQNCEYIGLELNNVYFSHIAGSVIQHNGGRGISINNGNLLIINGMNESIYYQFMTTIRYNNKNSINTNCALFIDDSYLNQFNHISIYENNYNGLILQDYAQIPPNSKNYSVLIANNTLNMTKSSNRSEIAINKSASMDAPFADYAIFNDNYEEDEQYLFWINATSGVKTLNFEYNYWKHWISASDTTNIQDLVSIHGLFDVNLILNDPWDSTFCKHNDYWALSEIHIDPQQLEYIALIEVLSDSLASHEEILTATRDCRQLVRDGYYPATSGFILGLREQGLDQASICSELEALVPADSTSILAYLNQRAFAIGNVKQSMCAFDEAIDHFEVLADTVGEITDSLIALIEVQKCIRLDAMFNGNNGGRHMHSIGNQPSRVISIAEKRIEELNEELYNAYNSKRDFENPIPTKFALHPAYPNPFNPSVNIPFALPEVSDVKLTVYNILGQRVNQLVNHKMEAGYHQVIWNGHSQAGTPVASGVYFVTMEAGGFIKTQKIVMVK